MGALEARLDGRHYLLRNFSLVDVAAASWLLMGMNLGLKLDGHSRVDDWCSRCAERAAFKRALVLKISEPQ